MSAIYEDSPKLRIEDVGDFVCPLCARRWDGGSGFRKAGARRHIFACWEKSLAARGLTLGDWSERRGGYRLHPHGKF